MNAMSQIFCVLLEVALNGLRYSNAATSHPRVECTSLLAGEGRGEGKTELYND